MLRKRLLSIVFLLTCVYRTGLGADEVFQCPDPFEDGAINPLTVRIDTAAVVRAKCAGTPRLLSFSRKRDDPDATSTTLCYANYSCPTVGPVPDPTPQKPECGCVEKSQDGIIRTFQVRVYADKAKDQGAAFSYQLCINPEHPTTKDIQKSCTSAPFRDDNGGCKTGCIIGIVAGVLGGVAIIAVLCFCIAKRKRDGRLPVPT